MGVLKDLFYSDFLLSFVGHSSEQRPEVSWAGITIESQRPGTLCEEALSNALRGPFNGWVWTDQARWLPFPPLNPSSPPQLPPTLLLQLLSPDSTEMSILSTRELVCPLSPSQLPFSLTSPYNALYCLYWILDSYLSAFSSQLRLETVYLFPQLPAQFLAHILSSVCVCVCVCVRVHTYTMQAKTLVPILALSLTWAHQLINCLFP